MQDLMQSKTYREAVEAGRVEGKIEGEIKGLLKFLSWTSPELAEKYETEVKAVQTETDLEKIEAKIKQDIESRQTQA